MISVKAEGLKDLATEIKDMAKQVNFASAVAVTRTAALARTAIYREMEAVFDRPTPYTMRSLYSTRATPANQQAMVLFRTFGGTPAEKYLGPEVYGGPRRAKRFEIALRHAASTSWEARPMPSDKFALPASGAKLDAYGNIMPGQITAILSRLKATRDVTQHASGSRRSKKKRIREDYFIRPGVGVFQRATFAFGSAIKPVILFGKQPVYTKRLRFFEVGVEVADRELNNQYLIALDQAVRTAR